MLKPIETPQNQRKPAAMFKVPEKYRVTTGSQKTDASAGKNGCFVIPMGGKWNAYVIASNGQKWEHVSVHIAARAGRQQTPTWNQMCKIKDMFWDADDVVIQLHPEKPVGVDHVLHLWRPAPESGLEIPRPPHHLFAIRNARQAISEPVTVKKPFTL